MQGYSLTESAKIDETVAPQMIDNRTGQVVTPGADGYYAVAGQGSTRSLQTELLWMLSSFPKITSLEQLTVSLSVITDSNGYDTGWSTKFPA